MSTQNHHFRQKNYQLKEKWQPTWRFAYIPVSVSATILTPDNQPHKKQNQRLPLRRPTSLPSRQENTTEPIF
jgi:hypothetical protein